LRVNTILPESIKPGELQEIIERTNTQ
jgi:hypothetical protein